VSYTPLHETDPDKAADLARKIIKGGGWNGPPVVVADDYLITGNHRQAAVALINQWAEDEIIPLDWFGHVELEVIQLAEVYDEAGVDMDEAHTRHDCPTISDWGNFGLFLEELPETIREKYGIQY